MDKTKRLLRLVKKYSLNKNMLVLNLDNINSLSDFIDKHYKIGIITDNKKNNNLYKYMDIVSNSYFNVHVLKDSYDLVCFNSLLEYNNDKDIIKIMKVAITAGEAVVFDVPIENLVYKQFYNNVRYFKNKYLSDLFDKLDVVIIEDQTYHINLQKHKIFVIRKRKYDL